MRTTRLRSRHPGRAGARLRQGAPLAEEHSGAQPLELLTVYNCAWHIITSPDNTMSLPRPPNFAVTVGPVLATLLTIHVLPRLASVLLLIFAGVILAVVIDALTSALRRVVPGGHAPAYAAAVSCILLVLSIVGFFIGPQLANEVPQLVKRMPEAWDAVLMQLNSYAFLDPVIDTTWQPFRWLASNTQIMNLVSDTFGVLINIFVVLFVAVYAAAAPRRYLHFGDNLLPEAQQKQMRALARDLGRGLRHWMLARSASMTIVGVATGVGLWILGVPLAFTLGLFAGLVSFVPYIGPILGLIPALLIAAVESLVLAAWVLVLFGVVQLIETMLLTPLIQQRAIAMPPVVLISVQLIGGVLIGPLGVLLAAPLVLCSMISASSYGGTEARH